MANSILIESRVVAQNVDAYNKSARADVDVAGGNLVAIVPSGKQGDDVFTAKTPAAGDDVWMAYNPSGKYIEDAEGNKYAKLSSDPRAYTNIAGEVFGIYKPQVNDEIVVTSDDVDDDSATAGQFYTQGAGLTLFKATEKPATGLVYQVADVDVIPFPPTKGQIGMTQQKAFHLICVQA